MGQTEPESERMRLLQNYSGMTDEQLEELAWEWESLTDAARLALKQEVERRGMHLEFDEEPLPDDALGCGEVVTIREFDSPAEAMVIKDMLESGGIRVSLADVLNHPLDSTSAGFGPVRLRVRKDDAQSAIEFLDSGSGS